MTQCATELQDQQQCSRNLRTRGSKSGDQVQRVRDDRRSDGDHEQNRSRQEGEQQKHQAEASVRGQHIDASQCGVHHTGEYQDEHTSDVNPGGTALRPQSGEEDEDPSAEEEGEDEVELSQCKDVDDLPHHGIDASRFRGLTGAVEEIGDVDEQDAGDRDAADDIDRDDAIVRAGGSGTSGGG